LQVCPSGQLLGQTGGPLVDGRFVTGRFVTGGVFWHLPVSGLQYRSPGHGGSHSSSGGSQLPVFSLQVCPSGQLSGQGGGPLVDGRLVTGGVF
jgi:hypothetical protein